MFLAVFADARVGIPSANAYPFKDSVINLSKDQFWHRGERVEGSQANHLGKKDKND